MAEKLGITELLSRVGDDNITFQNLDHCLIDGKWREKSGSRITFGTDVPVGPNGTDRLGLIVWLPRDAVKAILAAPPATPSAEGEDNG